MDILAVGSLPALGRGWLCKISPGTRARLTGTAFIGCILHIISDVRRGLTSNISSILTDIGRVESWSPLPLGPTRPPP